MSEYTVDGDQSGVSDQYACPCVDDASGDPSTFAEYSVGDFNTDIDEIGDLPALEGYSSGDVYPAVGIVDSNATGVMTYAGTDTGQGGAADPVAAPSGLDAPAAPPSAQWYPTPNGQGGIGLTPNAQGGMDVVIVQDPTMGGTLIPSYSAPDDTGGSASSFDSYSHDSDGDGASDARDANPTLAYDSYGRDVDGDGISDARDGRPTSYGA